MSIVNDPLLSSVVDPGFTTGLTFNPDRGKMPSHPRSFTKLVHGLILMAVLFLSIPAAVRAQTPDAPLRVFLECSSCDPTFVRETITYVAWMQARQDADLHVIARAEATGGAGRRHTLDFIGLQRHAGKADTLVFIQGPDDTSDTVRRGLSRVLALGMMRYLADTPAAQSLNIVMPTVPTGVSASSPASQLVSDPWKAWIFSLSGSGSTSGESSQSTLNTSASVSAGRTTEIWKFSSSGSGSYGRQSFEYPRAGGLSDTTVVSISRSYSASTLLVRSVNGHISVGMRGSLSTSTFGNTEFGWTVTPSIEYSYFPYTESSRRALTALYGIGIAASQYREETIYSLMEETRGMHSLSISYSTRQPWGQISSSLSGRQYFHDLGLLNATIFSSASINIIRGLSLSVSGQYAVVRDQLNLPKRNLSQEEILLRQRAVATNYRYSMSTSLSYRFGSSVLSVVNPRF